MKRYAYKAVLFDMDGVVVDTKEIVNRFWNNIAIDCNKKISKKEFENHIYGCQTAHTLDMLFPFLDNEKRIRAIKESEIFEISAIYQEVKGFRQFFEKLKRKNIATALVTSAPSNKVDVVLRQLRITNAFDIVITASDISEGKPNPQCYLLAADCLGLRTKECIVFEDAISGVKAAVGAGAHCVGINGKRNKLKKAGAEVVFRDFKNKALYRLMGL